MNFSESELLGYVVSLIWPFLRVSSMFVTIPVFGMQSAPIPLRVLLGMLLTFLIFPVLPAAPAIDAFSISGLMVAMNQVLIGLSAGFILQMAFSVILFAGQSIAYSMGLSFASMVDPATGVQVPVVGQFFVVSTSLFFLSIDGHLVLIEMLVQSFRSLPIALPDADKINLWEIIIWSSRIFADGLLLSLPVMATLLFVNICFGVASKAAPQLQLFGVGFPITILLGVVLMRVGLPNLQDGFAGVLRDCFMLISHLLRLN